MRTFEYKSYPSLPDWLVQHLYKILNEQADSPITYDDEFKDRMLQEAEVWMGGADQETLAAIANVDFDPLDTLGGQFTDAEAYTPFNKQLAQFDFIPVDNAVTEWVEENIPEKIIGVNLQVIHSGEIITPHVDELRHYALNYLLERGGDDVRTNFYDVHLDWTHQRPYARTLIPFEKIMLTGSYGISEYQWHKMDINTIHSVTNLDPTKKRISLSCSIVR
jgi:hypothetical protein